MDVNGVEICDRKGEKAERGKKLQEEIKKAKENRQRELFRWRRRMAKRKERGEGDVEKVEIKDFFFFEQKTAYEVEECDWSSDVCSSDLW